MSKLEEDLLFQIHCAKLPEPTREFRAIPGRKFRWDFAWPEQRLLLEVQGGTWGSGAHSGGAGASRDCEKHCLATIAGFYTFSVTSDQIRRGMAIGWLQSFFGEKAA